MSRRLNSPSLNVTGTQACPFSSSLHLSSQKKSSSVISMHYSICTWIMLQKAGRDGPEASRQKTKPSIPDISEPSGNSPSIYGSEFRNPVLLPQLTHGDPRCCIYQTNTKLSSKPDTSGARVFIGPPSLVVSSQGNPKETVRSPKSACQRS